MHNIFTGDQSRSYDPAIQGHFVVKISVWQVNTEVYKLDFLFENSLFSFLSFFLVPFSLNVERTTIDDFTQQFQPCL